MRRPSALILAHFVIIKGHWNVSGGGGHHLGVFLEKSPEVKTRLALFTFSSPSLPTRAASWTDKE